MSGKWELALDTSQNRGQMLLLENNKVLHDLNWTRAGSHSEFISLMLQNICDRASMGILDIKKIYCVCGPGSFTGCRVAVAFAKTLAYGLNCPLVSINTLNLLSLNCSTDLRPVFACMDAQKNSVFASLHKKNGDGFKNKLLPIQNLHEFIKEEVSVCGEGLNRYQSFIPSLVKKYLKQDSEWEKTDLKKYFQNPRHNEREISWMELQPTYINAPVCIS